MTEHYTDVVMAAITELAVTNAEIAVAALGHHLHVQTQAQHKKMLNTISALCVAGRVTRIRQGVYAPALNQPPPARKLRQIMWRVLRMRRRITIEDLQTMAGASYDYAAEWLRMLEDKRVVRKLGTDSDHYAVWQLLATDAELPTDDRAADRLRAYRAKKKDALAKMRSARTMINQAIAAMEKEDEG